MSYIDVTGKTEDEAIRKVQQALADSLAIWLMLLLVSAAFLCFSGVGDIVWLGVAAVPAVVSLWQIGRIVHTFGVDGKCC